MKILSCLVELGTVPTIAHGWYIPLSFTGGKNARAPESNHPPRALCTHVESFPPPWSSAEFFLMGSSCYTCPQPEISWQHIPITLSSARFFHGVMVILTGAKGLREVCTLVQRWAWQKSFIHYWTSVFVVHVFNAGKISYFELFSWWGYV